MDWPLIIAAGGSQVSPEYYAEKCNILKEDIILFPNIVSNMFNGYCINLSYPGSANSNNIRNVLVEYIKQKKANPTQLVIVLLELTFTLRDEFWIEGNESPVNQANFHSFQLANESSWWRKEIKAISGVSEINKNLDSNTKKYLLKLINAKRYWFSEEAEEIKLAEKLLMFTSTIRRFGDRCIIFRGNPVNKNDYDSHTRNMLMDFIDSDDNGIIDLDTFSFTQWCIDNNTTFLNEPHLPIELRHPSLESHEKFGSWIVNQLDTLYNR